MASIFALGARGDDSAIPALETLLKSDDLTIEMVPMIRNQIARLKKSSGANTPSKEGAPGEDESEEGAAGAKDQAAVAQRLEKLERLVQEMNERLKSIETRLPPPKQ